jgi:LPS sulfotransferase NodH
MESVARVMGHEHDFPQTTLRTRYVVLAAPRTGSTMLCSALVASRVAGHPMEYLNRRYIDAYRQTRGSWSLETYLSELMGRRTSPNGLFGVKIHPSQIGQQFGPDVDAAFRFVRSFDRFIRVYRRDTLAQAISHMLAAERGVWTSYDQSAPRSIDRAFQPGDVEKIRGDLAFVENEQRTWEALVQRLRLQVLDVCYEDMVADFGREIGRVFEHLGIKDAPAARPTTVATSDGHEAMKAAFLRATRGERG